MRANHLSCENGDVPGDGRVHYLDNLRALAMLAGVVFHAALAYSPLMHPVWPAADAGGSVIVDAAAWFMHMFRMPLFFALAGYFAALLVARRGMAGLFRNRCARVLLPLALFAPPVLVSMAWLTERAAETVLRPSPALAWIRTYVDQHGALPPMPGWAHLWFLFYLLLFTLMVWIASALDLGRMGAKVAEMPAAALVLVFPMLTTPALVLVGTPWPAPEFFVPALWALVFFGLYFAFGYQLFHHHRLLDRLQPLAPLLLAGAVVSCLVLFHLTDGFTAAPPHAMTHALHALLEACAGCWMTFWCLLAARRWLGSRSVWMRWLADSAYWVYIVHLPLLLAIQYRLLDTPWHWLAKFTLSLAATLLLAFASYQVMVRHTMIGKLLNGQVRRPTASATTPESDVS
ncbi:acyltransferase family protein [Pseudoxanthomonas sp.]|uniref:acyltransferase family protein n=1 Tax=Pseudoxanthomonas sp. TaxID=1871049 RepID=UPI002FDF99A9